jgi:hypothetical protein
MSLSAPLRVPVQLERPPLGRWWKLAHAVSDGGLTLGQGVSPELDGPLDVTFVLPGDGQPIRCRGRVEEVVVGDGEQERAELRWVRFLDLDDAGRARIETYVQERLGLIA